MTKKFKPLFSKRKPSPAPAPTSKLPDKDCAQDQCGCGLSLELNTAVDMLADAMTEMKLRESQDEFLSHVGAQPRTRLFSKRFSQ